MSIQRVVGFGELLMRLDAPGYQRLGQARSFAVYYTGAETNALVALANLGMEGYVVSRVPANDIGQACLDASIEYAKQRVQFGRPIAEFQAIQHKLADMAMEIEAARLLTYNAVELRDRGLPHSKEASMAKLFASETANRCAREAVQIFGGYGYTKDYPVERFFRDAKITEIYEGTSEMQRMTIARSLLAD